MNYGSSLKQINNRLQTARFAGRPKDFGHRLDQNVQMSMSTPSLAS